MVNSERNEMISCLPRRGLGWLLAAALAASMGCATPHPERSPESRFVEAFSKLGEQPKHRALAAAIDTNGHWAFKGVSDAASREKAIALAFSRCFKYAGRHGVEQPCRLVGYDDHLVWNHRVRSALRPSRAVTLLAVDTPSEESAESLVGLAEVRGRAGAASGVDHDILLMIDASSSTLRYSGYDLDGDGKEGVTNPSTRRLIPTKPANLLLRQTLNTVDFEDTVLAAELRAARALLDRLPLGPVRVAIGVFSDSVDLVTPFTADRMALRSALDGVLAKLPDHLGGTYLVGALSLGRGLFLSHGARDDAIRTIVLLSDGLPTLPARNPTEMAEYEAGRLAQAAVRVVSFTLGDADDEQFQAYARIASATGGTTRRMVDPGEIIPQLQALDLAGVSSLRIENATHRTEAIAVRRFPNGDFDAFVALEPGPNRLLVTATLDDGRTVRLERQVTHRPPSNEADHRATAAQNADLLERLEVRRVEIELWAESERARRERRGHLEIGPADRAPTTASSAATLSGGLSKP